MNNSSMIVEGVDDFKLAFKAWKQWDPAKPDLSEASWPLLGLEHESIPNEACVNPDVSSPPGVLPISKWKIYSNPDRPGLFKITNVFADAGNLLWCLYCLRDYPVISSNTNLTHSGAENVWAHHIKDKSSCLKTSSLWKLRWSTLGYHHNWDTKHYDYSHKSPMPDNLCLLTKLIAQVIGYSDYSPEASIINYYHENSTMSRHNDCSEEDKVSPLISISFGLPAVFLVGSSSKTHGPSAVKLSDGDVFVMAGQHRLAYHAVPLILKAEGDFQRYLKNCSFNGFQQRFPNVLIDFSEFNCLVEYMLASRINLNVRQVFCSC